MAEVMSGQGICCRRTKLLTKGKMCVWESAVVFLCVIMSLPKISVSQTLRTFPPLFNVAKLQAMRTSPSQGTCGIPTRGSYCRSSTSPGSVDHCRQEFCVQECPRRTSLPDHVAMLTASGFGACVTRDTVNTRPGADANDFSAVFNFGSLCYVTPLSSPGLGANGAFTVTFWMWRDSPNKGTVIEKSSNANDPIFRISITSDGVHVLYVSRFGVRELLFPDTIATQTWTFVALQVYDLTMSVFVNGTGPGYDSIGTLGLIGQVSDSEGVFRIGQRSDGEDQFVGRLQDVRFYDESLTNREVHEVYSSTLPDVRIDNDCRCPPTHPRVKPLDTRFCIRNGVPDNLGDEILRLNNDSHPLEYVNDGDSSSVWISSFLNDVIIEVDLQDQFQVFYVVLQFYSPQPKMVTIERRVSSDDPWLPWQQYAYDCDDAFGVQNNGPLVSASSVNCLQFETNGLQVPYSNGNITFSVLSSEPVPRPGHNDFYNTPVLIDFVKASQIRVRMQDHYYVTDDQHMYFGLYEYIVTGRCNCHGHASACDVTRRPYTCTCSAESNTQGPQCDQCKPLYNDKRFRMGDQLDAYPCKLCQCHDHASRCFYNETADPFPGEHGRGGGGTCLDCQHNTQGRLCDECVDLYYRAAGKSLYAEDVCTPCDCLEAGVNGSVLVCEKVGGQCGCKENTEGRRCDKCVDGYHNLQSSNPIGCQPCDCMTSGTVNSDVACHQQLGQCNCKSHVRGLQCDSCQFGFYNLTSDNPDGCSPCLCNPFGSSDQYCDRETGQCLCKSHVEGRQCDRCQEGYHDFASGCVQCGCDARGTEEGTFCDINTGQCVCKDNAMGLKCDRCKDGYYNLGGDGEAGCLFCGCDAAGTQESSQLCNKDTGECECKENVEGRTCNQCTHNAYNLTAANPSGCQACNCDPTGTLSGDQLPVGELACDHNTGQCTCLANRIGARCDSCTAGTYVSPTLGGGCLDCDCDQVGTIRNTHCDPLSGQCQCYGSRTGITGRQCDACAYSYFLNVQAGTPQQRCTLCNCDMSGSVNDTCDPVTGQCQCKQFTTGRQCGQCVEGSSGLSAHNPYGCSKGPSQQPPPDYTPLSANALRLFWDPPDYPNGVISAYYIYRDGQTVGEVLNPFNDSDLTYVDAGLAPYTDYEYQIEAVNDFGSTFSPTVTYRTPSGVPEGEITLSVGTVTARTASFSWQRPSAANGVIQRYLLLSTNHRSDMEVQHYEGLALEVTVSELIPYTAYQFMVRACTSGGCLTSQLLQVITREAAPEGQAPPIVEALSSSQLGVQWQPPEYPNGIIIYYELWIRGLPGTAADGVSREPSERRIFHPAGQYNPIPGHPPTDLSPPKTNATVGGLDGYTTYEFRVISENSLGKAASLWVYGRTAETDPEEVPQPEVHSVSSTELNVTWQEPTEKQARGEVTLYNVYHYAAVDLSINPSAPPYHWVLKGVVTPPERHLLVTALPAYINQTFIVELCNSVACRNSSSASGRTQASAPEGIQPPIVSGYNDSVMIVSWTPPRLPNGPEPVYTIRRTTGAFNNPPPLVSRGTRFNGQGYYKFAADAIPQGVAFTGIDLWFKTTQKNGLMVFAASEGGQEEFVALQLREGRPWFLFDPQGCTIVVTVDIPEYDNVTFSDALWHHLVVKRVSTDAHMSVDDEYTGCSIIVTTTDDEGLPYHDNTWHHLRATRIGQRGSIVMDDRWTGEKGIDCNTGNIIGENTGVYVGGLPEDYVIQREELDPRAQVITNDFQGCLRDVTILTSTSPIEEWTSLDWDSAIEREGAMANWEGCPDDLETAYHFLGPGYVIFQSGLFVGGSSIDFSFDMRTELRHGILFFAHGGNEVYWLIQIQDGGVYVEFGVVGIRQSAFFPNDTVSTCDGNWHRIRVQQISTQLTITVDNVYSRRVGEKSQSFGLLIASSLYIGGVPDLDEAVTFIENHDLDSKLQGRFGGCLKNIRVNRRPYNVEEHAVEIMNVNMDGCPSARASQEPCKSTLTEVIYEGQGNLTYDFSRLPFTEYLYQVEVNNEAGTSKSAWAIGRTREGVPWGVYGPTHVEVLNGFTLRVDWREPEGRTGVLVGYVIRSYNLDDPQIPPVEDEFNSTVFSAHISGFFAFTNYSVHVVACTNGGCTESPNSSHVVTHEEAPQEVFSPAALETGAEYISLSWQPPQYTNGILTGYALYMEDVLIYSGHETSFNVTGLYVYAAYRFYVTACSRVGCTNSSVAHLSTAQLPPNSVRSPTLTVLGTDRIQVQWQEPDELNGALERYLLFASTDQRDVGEAVYNSTDLFTSYIIAQLTAGTLYFISVGACTGGGCRLSDATSARTEESAPAGVRAPVATSPSPSMLNVTWQPPEYPNGVITLYRLYHNGLMIFNTTDVYEYTIDSLQPYSLHSLRLEACTVRGCSSSDVAEVRTMEAPPEGSVGLDVRVSGPRQVALQWNAVDVANGVVYYDVFFEGLYYVDAENWDYSTITERRSLHRSMNMSFLWVSVDGLVPYSTYLIQVNASNTQGYLLSNIKQADMPMGSPDGVKEPNLTSPDSRSVRAVWFPVGRANADQDPAYQLQFLDRNSDALVQNLFEQATTATTYLKTGLEPYTKYEFRLVAINSYGQTASQWASVTTMQDKPASVDPPMTSHVGTRSVDVAWEPPYQPHGLLTQYKLYQNETLVESFPSNVTRTTVSGLIPYTTYIYQVEACTVAGCTLSANSLPVTTLPAQPEGIPAPLLVSQSPTTVLISWAEPAFPNGEILQYSIERRLVGNDAITLVTTILPSDVKEYVDDDPVLSPYTTYEYRIGLHSGAGVGYGPWAEVTTKPSRPGGVLPPTVDTLSPTSMRVSWQEPIQLNGRLESYILKLPNPRFEVYNTSVLSMVIEDLTPYTEYRVTITVCTDGGCTESIPTVVMTSPSLPAGVSSPIATTHSQTYISVIWQPPEQPNGPNIRYELARTKIRQPLFPGAGGFGTWTSIYSGPSAYYEDRGLTVYTTYRYRLSVYNNYGHTTSDPSDEVTTYGGVPTKPAVVSAYSVNHTAIEVRWTTPNVFDLQGGVHEFLLNISSDLDILSLALPPPADTHVITDLEPNTVYTATVTIVTHGGETITSEPARATTTDGAPEGLDPPQLFVINQTAVRVAWMPPRDPNGQITAYFLYVDGQRIDLQRSEAGSYVLASLEPYTIYSIQIEVCTVFACLKSDVTEGSTAETAAAGLASPHVLVLGPYSLQIRWQEPAHPNGIILRYELYRKTEVSCTDPEPVNPEWEKCTYFECGILESFCGDQCYSGTKTCCNGVLHNNKNGYECCDRSYIPSRANSDDVCCGGQFHYRLDNYQCCGNRYVEVLPGEMCCPDPYQNRADIGYGDRCCGSVPYAANGSQICCDGTLVEKYKQKCCGGEIVSDNIMCCGHEERGTAYVSDVSMVCCGEQYVISATTACCTDDTGKTQAHDYGSAAALESADEKCCATERIPSGLSCCNGNGYDPLLRVCADVSDTDSGCGMGKVCFANVTDSAFCNRCDFDHSTHKCGSYVRQASKEEPVIGESWQNTNPQGQICFSNPAKIFTGDQFEYTDMELEPYTEYHYAVVAVNSAGSTQSDYTLATTSQTLPEGVRAPHASVQEGQLDTIHLTWQQPDQPNGEILWYILTRDGLEIFRDVTALRHTDDNAIQPYRTYTYQLKVCNVEGCVTSPQVRVSTLQARPSGVLPVRAEPASPFSLHITWSPPDQPNGYIARYELWESVMGLISNLSSLQLEFILEGLAPYAEYEFVLSACTAAGCTNSSETRVRTLQDRPQGVRKPSLNVVNASVLEVLWSYPEQPNGVIISNILYRSRDFEPFEVIYSGDSDNVFFRDDTVEPDTLYQYIVEISTEAGSTNSSISTVEMPSSTPGGIPAPHNLTALSSTEVYVAWSTPSEPNGNIDQYVILLNAEQEDEIEMGVGLLLADTVYGLKPYTLYEVRIRACFSGVRNGCGTGPGARVRTREAPPRGQAGPDLTATSSSAVEIRWQPPDQPNGVITQYLIYRRYYGDAGTGTMISAMPPSIRSFINEGPNLTPFTDYEYNIVAVNSQGETTSPWVRVRTFEAPPQIMQTPVFEQISAHSIVLSWENPLQTNGKITGFRIEYQVVSNDPTRQLPVDHVTLSGSTLRTSLSGLQPFTAYDIRVRAENSVGSVSSSWARTTTSQTSPADLSPFEVEKLSNGLSVILRWSSPGRPNGIINNYLIYEEGNLNAVYQGLNREFEYRRLQPFTEYTLQLEACTSGGCALSPLQRVVTAEIPPENQPAPALTAVNSNRVTVRWTSPVNAYGAILYYEVIRRHEQRRTKRALSEPEVVYRTEDTSRNAYEYVDSNLEPYTFYEYRVRTANSKGIVLSPWQGIETAQTAPANLLPPLVSHVGTKSDRLLVQWQEPGAANGVIQSYQLQRNDTVPWSFDPDDAKEYMDTGLVAYTLYVYQLTACTAGGCTTSEPTLRRTPEASPYFVSAPNVITVNSTALQVSWTQPEITNGQIQTYHLKIDGITVYSGLALEYIVGNLIPYTAYEVSVAACTFGGCRESDPVIGRPDEDFPQGMRPPRLTVTGSRSIEISWSPPDQPNGLITSYELERDGTLIQTTRNLQFVDFSVEPGQEYTYTVTAYNSKGSVKSNPASVRTYASAPVGLDPPHVQAISSSSIQATWSSPLRPNGLIYNYTLYVNNVVVFSANQLRFTVVDLQFYTVYSFRVEACTSHGCVMSDIATARTLEAPPTDLDAPRLTALADASGVHRGMLVQWSSPRKPNGIVIRYELYRRDSTGLPLDIYVGQRELLYSGMEEVFSDLDPALLPYTVYEYMVAAYNSEGHVKSLWANERTLQAPPEGVSAPIVQQSSVTSTTIPIEIEEPALPNGNIEYYNVFLNDTVVMQGRRTFLLLGDASRGMDPLKPYTKYTIQIEACTGGGCTRGPAITVTTLAEVPEGLLAPQVYDIEANSIRVSWLPPAEPNGPDLQYELHLRRGCPYPYADGNDDVEITCTEDAWTSLARGRDVFESQADNLVPYNKYDLRLRVWNSRIDGHAEATTNVITKPAAPEFIEAFPPTLEPSGNVLLLDWTNSFSINGEVQDFILREDGDIVYQGSRTSYSFDLESNARRYRFLVSVVTDYGEATSSEVVFGDDVTTEKPKSKEKDEKEVYEEVWFIVLLVIVILALLFVALVCCLKCSRMYKAPYVRERQPLEGAAGGKKPVPLAAFVEPYDGGVFTTQVPSGMMQQSPGITRQAYTSPGYVNPSYSPHISVRSHPMSDVHDNTPGMSPKFEDDDFDSLLEGYVPNDSGLHSLAYGEEEYDMDSDQPVSVLREHLVFTDTHL